ncbi:MAG: hypothetical protein QOJ96_1430 [Alphaproteobacteria bacterium]|jgi:hypothetical protein|nr:hypothetical protein [Alphaproteobacteria bacterium]
MPRKPSSGDTVALECARVSRAFASILSAAMASLLLHYAVRLAAAYATMRSGDRVAAVVALEQEREAALASLRISIRRQRKDAIERARKALRHDRFRISLHTGRRAPFPYLSEPMPPTHPSARLPAWRRPSPRL